MDRLTEMQKKFVEEYLIDSNQTKAAIRAGYSERSARTAGYRNMKNDVIKGLVDERRQEIRDRLQKQFSMDAVKAREVLIELLEDENTPHNTRLIAARDLLDRAGYKPTEDMNINSSGDMGVTIEWVSEEEE